jgi:hypothetical protein
MDELAVRHAIRPGCGVDSLNPKAAENSFAIPAIPESKHT